MNIHQVNVSYLGEHDRLLIRINSLGGEEFRAWLTRRLALKLLPHLDRTAQAQIEQQLTTPDAAAAPHAQRQQLVHNFQKEAAAYEGDFRTPFKEQASALPLGEEPLLVTEVSFTPLAEGKLQMLLLERLQGKQRDLQLVLDPALTQGLLRLLHEGLKASGWLDPAAPLLALAEGSRDSVRSDQELGEPSELPARPRYLN